MRACVCMTCWRHVKSDGITRVKEKIVLQATNILCMSSMNSFQIASLLEKKFLILTLKFKSFRVLIFNMSKHEKFYCSFSPQLMPASTVLGTIALLYEISRIQSMHYDMHGILSLSLTLLVSLFILLHFPFLHINWKLMCDERHIKMELQTKLLGAILLLL